MRSSILRVPIWIVLVALAAVGLWAWTSLGPATMPPTSEATSEASQGADPTPSRPFSPSTESSDTDAQAARSGSPDGPPSHRAFVSLRQRAAILSVRSDVETRWGTGAPIRHIDSTADGSLILGTSSSENRVYAIDGTTGEVTASVEVGKSPQGVRIAPDGTRALVANRGSNTVSVIGLRNGGIQTPAREIDVGDAPQSVAFAPNGGRAYVTLSEANAVAVLDLSSLETAATIRVSGTPHEIAVAPNGGRLYVTARERGDVAVVDLERGAVIWRVIVGSSPQGIAVSPDGKRVYVSSLGTDHIDIIDADTLGPPQSITVGDAPLGLQLTPDGRYLYVALTRANELAVLDTQYLDVVHRIGLDAEPFSVVLPRQD